MFCCLQMASDVPTRNTLLSAGDRHPSIPEQTTQNHCISRSLQGYPMIHPLSIKYKYVLLLLWPMQWLQMAISYKQEPPILLLHCTEEPSSSLLISTAHISGHSEMHIFTQLTLSPQLIDSRARENSSYTATGQIWWTTQTNSFYRGQDLLATREILFFFLHRWDFQLPDEEMKWCDIKQLMNLFN